METKKVFNADEVITQAVGKATEMGRNNAGLWLACQLRDNGVRYNDAVRLMHVYTSAVRRWEGSGLYQFNEAKVSLDQAWQRPPREPWYKEMTDSQKREWYELRRHNESINQVLVELAAAFISPESTVRPAPETIVAWNPDYSATDLIVRAMLDIVDMRVEGDERDQMRSFISIIAGRMRVLARIALWYYTKHPDEFTKLCRQDLMAEPDDVFLATGIEKSYADTGK